MKKILLIFAVLIGVFTASARDKYSHDVATLPVAARTILKNNFKADVAHIKIEKSLGSIKEYEVVLNDGSEITFDSKGNWKDVEVRGNASVPSGLVPDAITAFVKKNHKNCTITGLEKNRTNYEVELSNGVEMKFSTDGKFLRYDD
ncbi:MAG: hypothetical protein HDS71_00915 [Bacteroidales bacterium]|nr:hypothetical protein [Bacteroidales bacterium]MBD5303118.1 hypothetical protein [Bacteroides sp.]